ncbi:MAG: molybdopterin biosynthesis protein MoeA [Synergistales bacterium]|nr:molybdopterin biosynthesis protein MoeA [Synergistales bacterium]
MVVQKNVSLAECWRILREKLAGSVERPVKFLQPDQALGGHLAGSLYSRRNVPHFNASAVDGYALRAQDSRKASAATPVTFEQGQFQWVNTGNHVPAPWDAVVMVEDTSLDRETGTLQVSRAVQLGQNVRAVGEDVMKGQLVGCAGDPVSPALASLCVAAGLEQLPAYAPPSVHFIPTGDEILSQEEWFRGTGKAGQVVESNSTLLHGFLRQWGFPFFKRALVPDEPEALRNAIRQALPHCDVLLLSGGTAKGDRDHSYEVLCELGEVLFRGLLMRPGRPAMVGIAEGKPVVSLPGFPMSTAVVAWSVLYPILSFLRDGTFPESGDRMLEQAVGTVDKQECRLLMPHASVQGQQEWLRVKGVDIEGRRYVWPLPSGSSVLWSLAEADGLVLLPSELLDAPKDWRVTVWFRRTVEWDQRILLQGSNDPGLERSIPYARKHGSQLLIRNTGSLGGLTALRRGEAHLSASHLLDPETGIYNESYIRRLADSKWHRRIVYYRQQGLIVKPSMAGSVQGIGTLAEEQLRFVNRQPGAGTRVLLDTMLEEEGIPPAGIPGYENQSLTHLDAAAKVAAGTADVTLGIKAAADAFGLAFIPIREEPYELVIPDRYIQTVPIQALLETIEQEQDWRKEIEEMGGYRWPS